MSTCPERIKERKKEKQGRKESVYLANRYDGTKEEECRKEGRDEITYQN